MTRQQVLATLEVCVSPESYLRYLEASDAMESEAKTKTPDVDPVMELVQMLFEKEAS